MIVRGLVIAAAALGLAAAPGPAVADETSAGAAEALAAALSGTWDNRAQVEAEAAAAPEGEAARDRLVMLHAPFENAALPGAAQLYAQIRIGGPDGAVYRQRVFTIATEGDGTLVLTPWVPSDPEPLADAESRAAALAALTPEALAPLVEGCVFRFTRTDAGFLGETPQGACQVVARSGRALDIRARMEVRDGALLTRESGHDPETGATVFGPPGDVDYRFEPAAP